MTDRRSVPFELKDTELDTAYGGKSRIGIYGKIDMEYVLDNPVLDSFETVAKRDGGTNDAGDFVPVDTFSLNFGKIDVAP